MSTIDILPLIKIKHGLIRQSVQAMDAPKGIRAFRTAFDECSNLVETYFTAQQESVFAEFAIVCHGEALVAKLDAMQKKIRKQFKETAAAFAKKDEITKLEQRTVKIALGLQEYLAMVEDDMMLKMRQTMPFQTREDLGQLLIDFYEEHDLPLSPPVDRISSLSNSSLA